MLLSPSQVVVRGVTASNVVWKDVDMRRLLCLSAAAAAAGAVLTTGVVPPAPEKQTRDVRLINEDAVTGPLADAGVSDPLDGGLALILGTSGNPFPPQIYAEDIDKVFLQPLGFAGTTQILYTPEGLYPFTGVKSLPFATSETQDEQALYSAIMNQIHTGTVDSQHPVVVWGWSQSSDIYGPVMQELKTAGVPTDDVRFVGVGDAYNPDGGALNLFGVDGLQPYVPSLGIPFTSGTPADLYPTDIITNEYDFFGDSPRYPIDVLSDLNAGLGVIFDHITYPTDTAAQLSDAIQLPTAGDTLTNYFIIPEQLPLLQWLTFIPVIGTPLYDLLAPDASVLVDVGYGSVTNGWNQGPANIDTPMGFLPPTSVLEQVPEALIKGLQEGISDFTRDLSDPATNDNVLGQILNNPLTNQLIDVGHIMGFTDATNLTQLLDYPTLKDAVANLLDVATKALGVFANFPVPDGTTPTDILNDLIGVASYDYSSILPVADGITALLTNLPAYDVSLFTDLLADGQPLAAIGEPLAADIELGLAGLVFSVANPVEAIAGTVINLGDLLTGNTTF
jgi:hypothetical protein